MIGSLFTGYGGLDLAAEAYFGLRTAWTSDVDPGACKIIAHRFPDAVNVGDITQVDWTDAEPVEVVTGGFPCQDVSVNGLRAGVRPGTRSGLWSHMAYAVSVLRPRYVIAENVKGLLSAEAHSNVEPCPWCLGGPAHDEPDLRALGAVLGDLAALRYDARWVGLRASDVGAPHERFRVFVVAADTDRVNVDPALPRMGGASGPARGAGPADQRRPIYRPPLLESRPPAAGFDCGAWGEYAGTIRRWEQLTGRHAPDPHDDQALIAEWMMGLPEGWVTGVPGLSASAQHHAIGNGVVPQQAFEAIRRVLG